MSDQFNPVAFGRLEQKVEHMTSSVDTLKIALDELTEQVRLLKDRIGFSKGFIIGALMVGVLAIYGAQEFIERAFGVILK